MSNTLVEVGPSLGSSSKFEPDFRLNFKKLDRIFFGKNGLNHAFFAAIP
jgi:hypothetical protein